MKSLKQKTNNNKRMLVKITSSHGWAKKGDIHEVGCYIVFNFLPKGTAHYEKRKHFLGIDITKCRVVKYLGKTTNPSLL